MLLTMIDPQVIEVAKAVVYLGLGALMAKAGTPA